MWAALLAGRSGIDFATRLSTFDGAIAGEVHDLNADDFLPAKQVHHMDLYSQFAGVVAVEALHDAGLDAMYPLGSKAGVAFGTGVGGYGVLGNQIDVMSRRGPR